MKAISHDSIEGEFISADEWSEDQFNKEPPQPDRYASAREALRRQQEDTNPLFNQGMDAPQHGLGQRFTNSILGGIFGGGGFF